MKIRFKKKKLKAHGRGGRGSNPGAVTTASSFDKAPSAWLLHVIGGLRDGPLEVAYGETGLLLWVKVGLQHLGFIKLGNLIFDDQRKRVFFFSFKKNYDRVSCHRRVVELAEFNLTHSDQNNNNNNSNIIKAQIACFLLLRMHELPDQYEKARQLKKIKNKKSTNCML